MHLTINILKYIRFANKKLQLTSKYIRIQNSYLMAVKNVLIFSTSLEVNNLDFEIQNMIFWGKYCESSKCNRNSVHSKNFT